MFQCSNFVATGERDVYDLNIILYYQNQLIIFYSFIWHSQSVWCQLRFMILLDVKVDWRALGALFRCLKLFSHRRESSKRSAQDYELFGRKQSYIDWVSLLMPYTSKWAKDRWMKFRSKISSNQLCIYANIIENLKKILVFKIKYKIDKMTQLIK